MTRLSLLSFLCACAPALGTPTATTTAVDIIEINEDTGLISGSCINAPIDAESFDVERDLRVLMDISGSPEAARCSDIKASLTSGQSGAQEGDLVAEPLNGDDTLCVVRRDPGDGVVFMELRPNEACAHGLVFSLIDFQFPDRTTVAFEYVSSPP